MFTKRSIFQIFSVLLVVLLMSSTASARPLEAPLGTGFTYQGKLIDGGVPANGLYDFEFKLYDALSGGSPVGGTVTLGDVTVTNGLFTVQLDFGNVFDGTALYLEIGVRPGASVGAYTAFNPRQPLSATPYATYAFRAPWSGLTGVPASFADGVDNDTTYTAGDGLELVGTQFQGKGTSTQNVVIVAKSGGDFTTITAALNSITTASTTNRYLIYVAPGVYTETVTMKQYVDIEGSGELTTKITQAGSNLDNTGTVVGENNVELRFLTVENTGFSNYAVAIYNDHASPRLTHVTASALVGTHTYGVWNFEFSEGTMTDVTASASGGANNYGVYNSDSSPTMTDVTASASGGSFNYGVNNDISSPIMKDVTASASGGINTNFGVYNNSSSPTMTNVTASASGGTNSIGLYNISSSPTIHNSVISASGGTNNFGIYNYGTVVGFIVRVNNSQISGVTNTIRNDAPFVTRVGASQLSGGAVIGGGTLTCAGVYDENYTFYASACP